MKSLIVLFALLSLSVFAEEAKKEVAAPKAEVKTEATTEVKAEAAPAKKHKKAKKAKKAAEVKTEEVKTEAPATK